MTIFVKNKHTLQIDNFYFQCCIGKNGKTNKKKEGDKKTPIGTFGIHHLYFRKDRIGHIKCKLKKKVIKKKVTDKTKTMLNNDLTSFEIHL